MNLEEKLTLIKGDFKIEDAKEILQNIFSTKIQFHELKNFSSKERFGNEDEFSVERIKELKLNLKKLETIIENAKINNKKIKINSEINLSIITV